MTITARMLKDLIAEIDDNEKVVLRIKPSMSSIDDTITLNRVTYVEVVYNSPMRTSYQRKESRFGKN